MLLTRAQWKYFWGRETKVAAPVLLTLCSLG